jgi:tetratricopeptide (TPR) repeat protein
LDFITIGKFVTLKEYDMLENAGSTMIERYTNEDNITDILSNLYLKAEDEIYVPVFQKLMTRTKELYPNSLSVISLDGFFNMKEKNYKQALESYIIIKDKMEQDKDNRFYNLNLAAVWDNIAGCYLKLEDAAKTIESCDIALGYDQNAEGYKVGNPILYKKAEALLLTHKNEEALAIVTQILNEDSEDEKALEIKNRINNCKVADGKQ